MSSAGARSAAAIASFLNHDLVKEVPITDRLQFLLRHRHSISDIINGAEMAGLGRVEEKLADLAVSPADSPAKSGHSWLNSSLFAGFALGIAGSMLYHTQEEQAGNAQPAQLDGAAAAAASTPSDLQQSAASVVSAMKRQWRSDFQSLQRRLERSVAVRHEQTGTRSLLHLQCCVAQVDVKPAKASLQTDGDPTADTDEFEHVPHQTCSEFDNAVAQARSANDASICRRAFEMFLMVVKNLDKDIVEARHTSISSRNRGFATRIVQLKGYDTIFASMGFVESDSRWQWQWHNGGKLPGRLRLAVRHWRRNLTVLCASPKISAGHDTVAPAGPYPDDIAKEVDLRPSLAEVAAQHKDQSDTRSFEQDRLAPDASSLLSQCIEHEDSESDTDT